MFEKLHDVKFVNLKFELCRIDV